MPRECPFLCILAFFSVMKFMYQSSLVGLSYHLRVCKTLTTLIFSLTLLFRSQFFFLSLLKPSH
jgi:hypothetical protein